MNRFVVLLAFTATAWGQRAPVLAELFTSEGCSSCPPADALLQQLDSQVIVLSEHVDYWDRQGWRDPNSSHEFTMRQELYARALAVETFTPQLVVDGRKAIVGNDTKQVRAALAEAESRPHTPVHIASARREGAEAVVAISIPPLAKGKADVWVGVAANSTQSKVGSGENAGRTLTHVAVLRSLTKTGTAGKAGGLEKTVRLPVAAESSRVVVFLADGLGRIQGADSAPLP